MALMNRLKNYFVPVNDPLLTLDLRELLNDLDLTNFKLNTESHGDRKYYFSVILN